jgi:DeoR family transcriptional regulator of aga operon
MTKSHSLLHAAEKVAQSAVVPEGSVSPIPVEGSQFSHDGMMAEERRAQILQIVRTQGRVKVNELTHRFNTSAVTIRNDLNELHQRGCVLRSHGGAVAPETVLRESPLHERMKANSAEKRRIGTVAATMINNGEIIILDSGTTVLEIARQIKNKQNVQVITNGINIAVELLDAPGIQTFLVGGAVRRDSASIAGRSTEETIDQFSADKLFLGGAGVDIDFGVSGANLEETTLNRAMLRISREIILVADSSKFSKRCMTRIASFSEIDIVISDTGLSQEMQEKIQALGCKLVLA